MGESHDGGAPGDPTLEVPTARGGSSPGESPVDIPGYAFQRLLGRGGMGAVYLAEDLVLRRRVAIKLLAPGAGGGSAAQARERFLREARSMATLEHPNVVRVYGFGEAAGHAYLVMEYVEGETLGERVRRTGPLDPAEAARVLAGVVDALDAAWHKAIVHRDIKPGNILLDAHGGVHVADFGLAKSLAEPGDPSLSASGFVVGTPHYISPEQARGEPVDHRTDMYSLGVLAHEILTGSPPFAASTPAAVVAKHLHEPMPDLRAARPETPAALARLVGQMTRKDREARPASYAAVRAALAGDQADARGPAAPAAARRKRLPARRAALGLGGALALAGLASWAALARMVEETVPTRNLRPGVQTAERLGALAQAAGLRDVSFPVSVAPTLHVRAPRGQMRNARSLIAVADALHGYAFADGESVFTTGRASTVRLSLDVAGFPVGGLLNLVAGAAGFPVVQDAAVAGELTLKLEDLPWDVAVRTIFKTTGLAAVRHGAVWIVAPEARAAAIADRQGYQVVLARSGAEDLATLARSLQAAASETGVVAPNARLGAVVVADRPSAIDGYLTLLAARGSRAPPRLEPLAEPYMGSRVTLAFLESDTHEAFRLLADISGMNVVVAPGQFPDDRLSLSVRDVPWDNVWAAICESRDARLGIEGNLLSVSSLADASSAAAIESLRLENEDPAFFEPFARYLTSAGTLRADSESRTLVIRDVAPSLRRFRGWVRALDAHAGDGSGSGRDRR